jgi:hypothetical protein
MVLEVRNESLAGGLREIFEMLWETAKPVSLGAQKKRKTARRKG